MNYRSLLLRKLSRFLPLDLRGDAIISDNISRELSCIISFYGRGHLLKNILSCLAEQDYPRENLEVILVEDRGGTEEGKQLAEEYHKALNIKYFILEKNFGQMGYSRNKGIENSQGRYILFLDDDTVILQKDFLTKLIKEFSESKADAILARGVASYCVVSDRYQYHDPYFPTNRCVSYTRETLEDMGGFVSDIIGQEDVEFTIRLIISDRSIKESKELEYFHPPLIVKTPDKAAAVGLSFAGLRKKYPFILWCMLIANGLRYLPLYIVFFDEKCLNQARFSMGFLKGVFYYFTGKDVKYG